MNRIKVHWWGVQFGTLSVVWFDLWTHSWCWEMSRVRTSRERLLDEAVARHPAGKKRHG